MPPSSELAAGSGHTFEDVVAANYLTSLLAEGAAAGIPDRIVCRVALQQHCFREPMDDLIVDFRSTEGEEARLSLQIKHSIVISSALSNVDFREVIYDSWDTLTKTEFRDGVDRFGGAVGHVAKDKARALRTLCEMARGSLDIAHFESRFSDKGSASAAVRAVCHDISVLLQERLGTVLSFATLQRFLAHFVLIQFDYLHEGASDPPAAINALSVILADGHSNQAPQLWYRLCSLAREAGATADQYDRPRLVQKVAPLFRLRGANSLHADLAKLTGVSRDSVVDIENDVGGTRLQRAAVNATFDAALRTSRFIQIRGLPGSGKSALLRRRVEAALETGPVLFLKFDRLEGRSWRSFANAIGLSSANLIDLLIELEVTGSNTLFVDGIDRLEKPHRLIILDIIQAILGSPLLSQWRIAVSLRDTGIEPLRTWLPPDVFKLGLAAVDVKELDDEESEILATAEPHLRPLLFGSAPVQEIVRRPFFAKILSRNFAGGNSDTDFKPRSEVDLIANWWARGGYDCDGQTVIRRQRALMELAGYRARNLSAPVSVSQLSPLSFDLIHDLTFDGILQHAQKGHAVRFSHDIFFEWAYFHCLLSKGVDWPDEVRAAGEPSGVARAVELLSQSEFSQGQMWVPTLQRLLASDMRPQWGRAWLLGPLMEAGFVDAQRVFIGAVQAHDWQLLRKALTWLQAEKTVPNPQFLDHLPEGVVISRDARLHIADLLAWPSDFAVWARALSFVIEHLSSLPVTVVPDVIALFEVWQNARADEPNHISEALLGECDTWLRDIEVGHGGRRSTRAEAIPWTSLPDTLTDLEQTFRRLILRAAKANPERVATYLHRVVNSTRPDEQISSDVIDHAFLLAQTHAKLLTDLALNYFRADLPDDHIATATRMTSRLAEFGRHDPGMRPQMESGDEAASTAEENWDLSDAGFSFADWDRLSLRTSAGGFDPPSPLREPFNSLFASAPLEALRLLRGLSNHAVASWRQLHRLESWGTPIPVDIVFPWGTQQLWGGSRQYLWHRGFRGPDLLMGGYLALENWIFAELDRGREPNTLIRQIVEGHDCIAILGSALVIALQTNTLSETVLPLLTSQRIWRADRLRMEQEDPNWIMTLSRYVERSGNSSHLEAVTAIKSRSVRRLGLRDLVTAFVLGADTSLSGRAQSAILDFPKSLPFELQEDRHSQDILEQLEAQAHESAEWGRKENYRANEHPEDIRKTAVSFVNPLAPTLQEQARIEQSHLSDEEHFLCQWAQDCFNRGQIGEELTLAHAVEQARQFDSATLYETARGQQNLSFRRGAVVGVAAVVLQLRGHSDETTREWARDVVDRARRAIEVDDLLSSASIVPWHHGVFAARGLAADIRSGFSSDNAACELLRLIAYPLQGVALAAITETLTLWDYNQRLVWCGLALTLALSYLTPLGGDQEAPHAPFHMPDPYRATIADAFAQYSRADQWPVLPRPPRAWLNATSGTQLRNSLENDCEDNADVLNQEWRLTETHWHSQLAAKALRSVPCEKMMASEARAPLVDFLADIFRWTLEQVESSRAISVGHIGKRLSEWRGALGRLLARTTGSLETSEIRLRFLDPLFALDHQPCWFLMAPFVDAYIRTHILDADHVADNAVPIVDLCLTRFLSAPQFTGDSDYAEELHGLEMSELVYTFLFVMEETDSGAAHLMNLDVARLQVILPLVDRFLRAAGWAHAAMSGFLTLCERTCRHYPAPLFADEILAVMVSNTSPSWQGTALPARIASLVQHFADRESPMPSALAQKFLRILDLLVDMGDRRSAALQLSDSFRNIRLQ